MEIFRHILNGRISVPRPVLTMGNFDGIHLGHQTLLKRLVQEARDVGGYAMVMTFEPHPLKLLAPERAPKLILRHKDKMVLLRSMGVDGVVIQEFNQTFAAVEAGEFVRKYLVEGLRIHRILVGRGFRFGSGRRGDVESLTRWGQQNGFEVKTVEAVVDGGERISSTRIRTLIEQGAVHQVKRFLGRYHFVSGRVARGYQRGRTLGFPTANIAAYPVVLPPDGIYATTLWVGGRRWSSVTSLGCNPTFGDGPRTLETFLFDYDGDLYNQVVRVFFVKRIRDQKKFSTPELLVDQMRRDVREAKAALEEAQEAATAEFNT